MAGRQLFLWVGMGLAWTGGDAWAQRLKVGETSNKLKRYEVSVVGANADGFLTLKTWEEPRSGPGFIEFNPSRAELLKFSNDLNLDWERTLDLPPSARPVQVIMSQDQVQTYYGFVQKEAGTYLLLCRSFDAESGKPHDQVLEVWSIPYDKKNSLIQVRVARDPSTGNTFCVGLLLNEETPSKGQLILRQISFNGSLGALMDISLDSLNRFNRIVDWAYLQDGRWAVLLWSGNNMQAESRGGHRAFVVDPANLELTALPQVPGAMLRDQVRLKPLPQKGLVLAGFHRDNWDLGRPGILVARYSRGSTWDTVNAEFFKGSVIGSLEDPGAKTSAAMENLKLLEIFIRNDGGMVLLGENSFVLESRSYNMYSQVYSTTYTYHFNNAYLFGLSANGGLEWNEVLRKNQVSENDGGRFSSLAWVQLPDRIILGFNQENRQKSSIQLVNINGKGQSKVQELTGNTRDLYPEFKKGMQVSPYEWIGPCIKEGKKQLMMLSF